MTSKKIILQNQQEFISSTKEYKNNINLFITSSENLVEGTMLLSTKLNVYLDFGTKFIVKTPRKIYIKNLIQLYAMLKASYLNVPRPDNTKIKLKNWIKNKLTEGQKIKVKISNIDSLKDINTIDFKKTLKHIRLNKFFSEINFLKKSETSIRGFITNSIKGGFSVAIGSLITFLPTRAVMQRPSKRLTETFVNSSMKFKVSNVNIKRKNIVLIKA
jgi:hypothetical protein